MARYKATMRHGKFVFQNTLRPYYSTSKWNEYAIPRGIIFLYEGNSCPAGYEKLVPDQERFLTAGDSYQLDAGGSLNHTHETDSHYHTYSVYSAENSTTWGTVSGDTCEASYKHRHLVECSSDSKSPKTEAGNYNNCEIQPTYRFILCRRI